MHKKHGIDVSKWVMGEHIQSYVLKVLKIVLMGVQFLLITCDEIASIDDQ